MQIMTKGIAISLFILASFPVSAEVLSDGRELNPSSTLGKYLYSMNFYQGMYNVAVQRDRALEISCNDKYDIKPVNLVVLAPINLPDGSTQATAGTWIYRYDAVRCGTTKRYNLMMTAQSDAAPRASILLPGDTITTPQLMVDAMKVVTMPAFVSLGKQCKELQVFDTALVDAPHTVTEGQQVHHGVWLEKWTFQGCGKQTTVPVTFIPDGKGGTSFSAGTPSVSK